MEKISVIIPAYNCEKYINKCIDNLLAQSGGSLEIIVINDCSGDNTLKILQGYGEKIHLIDLKENKGSAAARNEGLKAVSGDFVLFVDSDDYLDKDCIARLMEAENRTKADIIRFSLLREYPDKTEKYENNIFGTKEFIGKKDFKERIYPLFLKGISLNSICRTLFKTEVIRGIRFDSSLKTAEDALFSLEAYTKAESFLSLSSLYYHYYQGGAGLTGNGISVKEKYRCNLVLSKAIAGHLAAWGMDSPGNKISAYMRLVRITFDKIKRSR